VDPDPDMAKCCKSTQIQDPRTLTLSKVPYDYKSKIFKINKKIKNKLNDTFMVGPISPPGMEKSVGRMIHFCIRWAFDVALLLYLGAQNKCFRFRFFIAAHKRLFDFYL
jgi:hypothetical protein